MTEVDGWHVRYARWWPLLRASRLVLLVGFFVVSLVSREPLAAGCIAALLLLAVVYLKPQASEGGKLDRTGTPPG